MDAVDAVLNIGVRRAIARLQAGDATGAAVSLEVALWTAQTIEAKGSP